ncbi:non-ribosomal peptide synthetase [Pseudomonas sp. H3(2019)]|uniref:non-ribosomal peptide synthetase n=1 Tax=Pseudomonas sp. H3(2019) TaxID=2598724 RepID=UPI0011962696|nr:non-ribosomal peptide synthetase [Pseudomonas sp. H3(2019)]TVT86075.1 amino acid adenylation domain-containing protein [Pseudomonas sp. H3(2019)]
MFDQQGTTQEVSGVGTEDLKARVAAILGDIGRPNHSLDWRGPLSQYRLSSLQMVSLWLAIKKTFQISMEMQQLIETPSLEAMLDLIQAHIAQRQEHLAPVTGSIPADGRSGSFALTPIQQSYFMSRLDEENPDAVGCNLYREFVLPDADVARLKGAWQQVVTHQKMLRVVVGPDGTQGILPHTAPWGIAVHDAREFTPATLQIHLDRVRARLCGTRFRADAPPYFSIEATLTQGAVHVHFCIDGMLTDGIGLAILLQQWWRSYHHPDSPLPTISLDLSRALEGLEARTRDDSFHADLAYWGKRLSNLPGAPACLLAQPRPTGSESVRRSLRARIAAPIWQALKQLATRLEVSPSSLVLSVFAQALYRTGPEQPFSLVLTTNNRPWLERQARGLVGPFTGSMVFVAGVPGDSAEDYARQTHRAVWQDIGHAGVDGVVAVRQLRKQAGGHAVPPLPVVFSSLLDLADQFEHGPSFEQLLCHESNVTSGVYLEHEIKEEEGALQVHWDIDERYFPQHLADALFAHFINGLHSFHGRCGNLHSRQPSDLQQAYWVARTLGDEGCQVYQSFQVRNFALERLENAWQQLIGHYEVLHSVYGSDGLLHVLAPAPKGLCIPVYDLSTVADGAGAIAALRDGMAGKSFALDHWPPFDIRVTTNGGDVATVHCAIDLALVDAVSILRLARELLCLYADPSYILPTSISHTDFERARDLVHMSPVSDAARAYWVQRLQDLPAGPVLKPVELRPVERLRVRLEGRVDRWARVQQRLQQHNLSADALLSAAFMTVLAGYQKRDFSITVVRWSAAYNAYRPGEYTGLSWLRAAAACSLLERARRHQADFNAEPPLVSASGLAELRKKVMKHRRDDAFALPVVYTGIFDGQLPDVPTEVSVGPWITYTPDVSLDAISVLESDTLHFYWDAVEGDFEAGQLRTMFAEYQHLIETLACADDWEHVGAEAACTGMSQSERETILYAWNDTEAAYETDLLPYQFIESQARIRPLAIALRGKHGDMNFAELNRFANYIAWQLKDAGVGPEVLVAISVQPSPLMVAAVLAVHKAGGAYLPLDPGLPKERMETILSDAGARHMIVESLDGPDTAGLPCRVFGLGQTCPGDDSRAQRDPQRTARVDSSAYIIYTSGSTGKPKGVLVAHKALLNLLNWANKNFAFGPDDVGLAVASLGFDLSVFDLFGLLGCGAGLYIADVCERKDPGLLMDILLRHPISFWNSSPAALHQLSPLLTQTRMTGEGGHLRVVFLSGDFTPLSLPDEVRGVFPYARIINLGGATEATVWSNYFHVGAIDPTWRSIPYGVPIDNSRYHVLDDALDPCPVGVEGDLFIGGDCLSVGYWRRSTLTAASFIPDPYSRTPGQRLYRTGDRAAYLPDGNLTFIGRIDGQVKIRGNRVELEEIDFQLRSHPGVKEALTLARDDHTGDRKLVAYVIARSERPGVKTLREHVAKTLPVYMVPNFICFIDALPCTSNGKVDRAALPWPIPREEDASPVTAQPIAQTGPSEETLRTVLEGLFAEQLSLTVVAHSADLWDLGASSFTMIQVSNALQRQYGTRVPVSALVAHASVEGIARVLHGLLSGPIAEPVPTPVPAHDPRGDAAVGPAQKPVAVDLLDAGAVSEFKARQQNLRVCAAALSSVALPERVLHDDYYDWRASHREFGAAPIALEDMSRLLGLLRTVSRDDGKASLYASAGSTYAVQTYLHVKAGAVTGLEEGGYYYHPLQHRLVRVDDAHGLNREQHFYYNRPLYDRAAIGLFLIGESKGIEPLYGDQSQRYLQLEAGHMAQLLSMGQVDSRIGLCGIGAMDVDALRAAFCLSESHGFLYGFLGGSMARTPGGGHAVPWFGEAAPAASPASTTITAPVAIIGMAGQFACADTPDKLWQCLRDGRRAIGSVPSTREWAAQFPDLQGGFINRIDQFDHALFHVSPREAKTLDPQTRLLLQTVWACLEDAGHTARSLRNQAPRVGVFVAVMWHDYQQQGADTWRDSGLAAVAGSASDIANRISHFFDFNGPSLAVNTSCSSSLSALQLAKNSLDSGQCDAAIVAAVNLIAHPYHAGLLTGLNLLSGQSVPCAFDGEASGWTPGEGCSAVLLRPQAAAQLGNDHTYALLDACHVVHAGKVARYGAPDSAALAGSLSALLDGAGVSVQEVDYVECAAAGASIADSAELEALEQVFSTRGRELTIGTLKPNIGHLEAAAGMAQVIKVLLQMRHGEVAPTLLADPAHRLSALQGSILRVAEQVERWSGHTALINAVGASGTHAFALLRAAPSTRSEGGLSRLGDEMLAVPLSAASVAQLDSLAQAVLEQLANEIETPLDALAYTLQTGRVDMGHRLLLRCRTLSDLRRGLTAYLQRRDDAAYALGHVETDQPDEAVAPVHPHEVCARWLTGTRVDWENLWQGRPPRRVSLPTYPFSGDSHWLDHAERSKAADEHTEAPHDVQAAAERYLCGLYAECSGLPVERVRAEQPLEHLGLSSLIVTDINAMLTRDLGGVSKTLLFEHADLRSVARALSDRHGQALRRHLDTAPATGPVSDAGQRPDLDIAIIGIAGRYPGADNLNRFWANLEAGTDCIRQLPPERTETGWPVELMWGGFLDRVDLFDPLFFNISPRDADLLDPQTRLFMQVMWHTLEDAGYGAERLRRAHEAGCGVFVGSMYSEYHYFGVEQTLRGGPVSSGSALADIANRVSYFLGAQGPSLTVDTMCSSSLTAIHLAIQSLRRGECAVALAGGVNLSLHPDKYIALDRLKMVSSDHRCRSFGAGGDGFIPGEGAGAVLLKPLHAALADGDRIHAVIKGSAINHGGRTNGYMVPNPLAHARLIRSALQDAQVESGSISYIEAHGTGTALGDPVEINGLTYAFEGSGLAAGACAIGSVKSQIGHLEAAAGIAGLTKLVLQMKHRRFACSLHAQALNPNIAWESAPFRLQRLSADWITQGGAPRRAGISSFGAGGANGHLIVESFDAVETVGMNDDAPQLILISAKTSDALRRLAGHWLEILDLPQRLADLAYTAQIGREPMKHRLALVVDSVAQLRDELEAFLQDRPSAWLSANADDAREPASSCPELASDRAALRQLARYWVAGGEADWSQLQRPVRCGLTSLPIYPFAQQRCWLAPQAAPIAAQPLTDDMPLFAQAWRQEVGGAGMAPLLTGRIVCLASEGSLDMARRLVERLGPQTASVLGIDVQSGDADRAVGIERTRTQLAELIRSQVPIAGWIDLCDLDAGQASNSWLDRLALLQQVMVTAPAGQLLRVMHASNGLHSVQGEASNLLGVQMASFIKTLAAEHKKITLRTIDLDPDGGQEIQALLTEWHDVRQSVEVCYRHGQRYVPYLKPIAPVSAETYRLDPDAVYLITGGLRGLGAMIALEWARRGARKLALIGSRALPPRAGWDDPDLPTWQREAVANVRALEAAGAQVMTAASILTDVQRLQSFLADVRRSLGEIRGVIHCAGNGSQGRPAFVHKTPAQIESSFAPKFTGLCCLAEACTPDRLEFFLAFSSISAVVGALGAGVSDYAAANVCMDRFVAHMHSKGQHAYRAVNWPFWAQSSGSDASREACSRLGLEAISNRQGLRLLDRVLALKEHANIVPLPLVSNREIADVMPHFDAVSPHSAAPLPASPGVIAEKRVAAWLMQIFSDMLRIRLSDLDPQAHFSDLGVESVMMVELIHAIEREIGRPLEPSALLDYPTLNELSRYLGVFEIAAQSPSQPPAEHAQALAESAMVPALRHDIAIVGMSGRFPDAPDIETFWNNLKQGHCAVHEVPSSRWDIERFYRPAHQAGKSISKWGGFISGIEDFDPGYFNMSRQEASECDPAIRMMLEESANCLSDAGYAPQELSGKDVGIYIGARMSGYRRRMAGQLGQAGLGGDQNFIAARVAHHFDFCGPCMVVDSACSSALSALQLACQSLALGESALALAGGVDILLDEEPYLEFSEARALSPSGRCRTFDKGADGFVPGEGCGVLLLKRLDAALRDGDPIHAVIRGVAANNDGRTMGLTTPNPKAQSQVIRRALAASGLTAENIGMVEAHGTGTMIGDPIELKALTDVFREHTGREGFCAIGSVKSNVGHLLSAAGIAGLFKAVLCLKHGQLPPTLFCDTPNPRFDFQTSPFYPNTVLRDWPAINGMRAAGISAFGLGGTNVHLIVSSLDAAQSRTAPVRPSLPRPSFQRVRCWLEVDSKTAPAGLSPLRLDFGRQGDVASARSNHSSSNAFAEDSL